MFSIYFFPSLQAKKIHHDMLVASRFLLVCLFGCKFHFNSCKFLKFQTIPVTSRWKYIYFERKLSKQRNPQFPDANTLHLPCALMHKNSTECTMRNAIAYYNIIINGNNKFDQLVSNGGRESHRKQSRLISRRDYGRSY